MFIYFWERERERERERESTHEHTRGRGREREADRGSEAGSALTAESLMQGSDSQTEIMTWAEVKCLADGATQVPLDLPDLLKRSLITIPLYGYNLS